MEQNNVLNANTEILSEFLYKNKINVEDVMEMLSKEMANKKKRDFVLSKCNVPDNQYAQMHTKLLYADYAVL